MKQFSIQISLVAFLTLLQIFLTSQYWMIQISAHCYHSICCRSNIVKCSIINSPLPTVVSVSLILVFDLSHSTKNSRRFSTRNLKADSIVLRLLHARCAPPMESTNRVRGSISRVSSLQFPSSSLQPFLTMGNSRRSPVKFNAACGTAYSVSQARTGCTYQAEAGSWVRMS